VTRGRAGAYFASLCFAVAGWSAAASVAAAAPVTSPLLAPADVLARYEASLDAVKTPPFVRFEYTVEQAGPRNFAQAHRVYRSGLTERDELRGVEGQALSTPEIRVFHDRLNRYAVKALAPRAKDYTFSFVGPHADGSHVDYVFATSARAPGGAFVVDSVTVDGIAFLPRIVSYTTLGTGVRGHGTLTFAKADKYWLIVEATATARIGTTVARERITFGRYAFPRVLPESTFAEPRPRATQK
jgi:hypothetical protein